MHVDAVVDVFPFLVDFGDVAVGFYADGPVPFAPAISGGLACFGSDDGCLYCVELATGNLRWKHRAVPSQRRLLGNKRLISVWAVRGGPVVADAIVYFAAGVWPFEGVFVYAMEMDTGKVLWRSDRLGYLFGLSWADDPTDSTPGRSQRWRTQLALFGHRRRTAMLGKDVVAVRRISTSPRNWAR